MLICCQNPTYSTQAHDDVLQQWEKVKYEAGPLRLDLSRVQFVDPYGLCALVIFLNHLPEEALPVHLTLPGWPGENGRNGARENGDEPSGPVSYLTRMGFWEEVGTKLAMPESKLPVRPLWLNDRNMLLDITIMHTHDAISVMLRKTGEILQKLNYTVPGRGHVLEVLSELCSNVLMHAQTDFGGVAAMQTYKARSGVRYIVMSIGDHGIGVRRSLANNSSFTGRLESDAQALSVAVQPGASRFASGGHGGGLPRVIEIARRYGGRVAFRSGGGAFAYNGTSDERRVFESSPLTGTQLRIALPETGLRTSEAGDWKMRQG